jgi:hypothetical protein
LVPLTLAMLWSLLNIDEPGPLVASIRIKPTRARAMTKPAILA